MTLLIINYTLLLIHVILQNQEQENIGDVYIVGNATIDLLAAPANEYDKAENEVTFKNNVPFRSCISKINNTLIDNAEDLDIVMLVYNLLEYTHNYSMTSGSLWNYYGDKIDNVDVNDSASDGKSFKYKTKIIEKTPERPLQTGNTGKADLPPLNTEVTISLKYLNHFWRSLDLPLIYCKV